MQIDNMPIKAGAGQVAESIGGWLASWMMGGLLGGIVLLSLKLIAAGIGL